MLRQFLPLFAMTFLICTFIVLMQFLWLHLQDLVGKGVGISVLSQLFFYAALSMVPMALPLAVLLASLMTFGNIGESLELTAMKAGGISLFRVMRPLIILMVFVSVGAFFFQNDVLPLAQTKMWTLLKSVRQKTPELDIVEGEFNYQLPNINIYVAEKDRESGMLRSVMIYDFRQGFDRSRVIRSDSATLTTAPDKTHMYIDLHAGELFENMREGQGGIANERNRLYRREEFVSKHISVDFDVNLEMIDENELSQTYAGKNVSRLRSSIDSMGRRLDSIGTAIGSQMANEPFVGITPSAIPEEQRAPDAVETETVNPDAERSQLTLDSRRQIAQTALNSIDRRRMERLSQAMFLGDEQEVLRRHQIELYRRFTLSLACMIFFFIGAPLGAIIRKGGIGTPLVISVFLFIFYYIIDNTGYRLARDGQIPVWEGIWLSSAVLLPLGIFVTYKAVKDSAVFNADSYMRVIRMILGNNRRALTVKEVVIEDFDSAEASALIGGMAADARRFLEDYPRPVGYRRYWTGGISQRHIAELNARVESAVAYASNSRSQIDIAALNALPVLENLAIFHPFSNSPRMRKFMARFVLAGVVVWLLSLPFQQRLLRKISRLSVFVLPGGSPQPADR